MPRPCKTETDECISRYFEDIKDSKPLTYIEEVRLARRIQKGDNKAVEKLVFANLKFVIFRFHAHPILSLSPQIQTGMQL